jgi:hypothetical protein
MTAIRTTEVTLQDLGALPLRASVAFAVRCARRVRPCFRLPEEYPQRQEYNLLLDAAIQAATEFARDLPGASGDAAALAKETYEMADATEEFGHFAAYAGAHAVNAAAGARAAGTRTSLSVGTRVAAAVWGAYRVVVASATGMTGQAACAPEAVATLLRADYEGLLGLGLGAFGQWGQPVDPGEAGPLGPLWPHGEPRWV